MVVEDYKLIIKALLLISLFMQTVHDDISTLTPRTVSITTTKNVYCTKRMTVAEHAKSTIKSSSPYSYTNESSEYFSI